MGMSSDYFSSASAGTAAGALAGATAQALARSVTWPEPLLVSMAEPATGGTSSFSSLLGRCASCSSDRSRYLPPMPCLVLGNGVLDSDKLELRAVADAQCPEAALNRQ